MESLTQNARSTRARGASMVEFALLTAVIVVGSAAGFRALGHSMARAVTEGTTVLGGTGRETRVGHLPSATDPR
jgi:Flp pilus assembly pilin Flp